jgi:hypothetical protein
MIPLDAPWNCKEPPLIKNEDPLPRIRDCPVLVPDCTPEKATLDADAEDIDTHVDPL